jgi:hypothetical protein
MRGAAACARQAGSGCGRRAALWDRRAALWDRRASARWHVIFEGMKIMRIAGAVLAALCVAIALAYRSPTAIAQPAAWVFAASGDSRNCGDIVMPAIAEGVLKHQARFYWHLGDLRKVQDFDEDMAHQPERLKRPMTIVEYENQAWNDYIDNQIAPFGLLPVFVGIGNHETYWPKTRADFLIQFADWLDAPVLQRQRLADNPKDRRLRAYYHWIDGPVDFIYLDNATSDQFDGAQMAWLRGVLERARGNANIKSLIVGMHEALPESISAGHSMNESPAGTETGRTVYRQLLDVQNVSKKHVYVLASHSHFYMDGIFNTEYWRTNGGVLPGWIVGTAGAMRYALPPAWKDAKQAETNVYGYLLGTVQADGSVDFQFQRIVESDVPAGVVTRYKPEFVHWCFAENHQ